MGPLAVPVAVLPGPEFLCPWLNRQRGYVEGGRVVMVMGTSASRPSRPRDRGTEVCRIKEGFMPDGKRGTRFT